MQPTDKEIKEARVQLWEMGILEWKLSPTQKKMYDFYHNQTLETIIINCSRRLGKSFLLTIMAFEQCLKEPGSIVKFIQPKVNMIRKNLRPTFLKIMEDCPHHLRPEFKTQDNMWVFPNGSEIHLAGTDNGNAENLRGGDCHLGLVDEAGFCSDLKYIIDSILGPTMALTNGRMILSSTTPPDPDHEFVQMMTEAEIQGNLIRKTIYDAYEDDKASETPRITLLTISKAISKYKSSGGELSDGFRTEFMCEVIFNSKDSVVPEFTKEIQQDTIVPWRVPNFYDRYVSMDIGFRDLTVVLFGFWDFDNGALIIQDEQVINGNELTTSKLAELIIQKEESLWTHPISKEIQRPYMRVSDNNLIVINDLQRDYGITFLPTEKHNKDAYLNQMRIMIQSHQIMINPKCKTLITHLKSATWDKTRKEFKRSPDNGHYDAVDALAYMVRNIDKTHNPYPKGYKYSKIGPSTDVFIVNEDNDAPKHHQAFAQLFKPKRNQRK